MGYIGISFIKEIVDNRGDEAIVGLSGTKNLVN